MNATDKNYVDRLHNQQVNELNEIKNRLTILEGKSTSAPDGPIHVELDADKLYDILLRAYENCLQQRLKRRQGEDCQAEERLRQECEAKGERYFSNVHEWRAAIARDYDDFFQQNARTRPNRRPSLPRYPSFTSEAAWRDIHIN